MNAKITATIAVAVVAAMVFAAAGAVTYSWFSDTEEANINVTTATVDMSAKYKYEYNDINGTKFIDWTGFDEDSTDIKLENVISNGTAVFTVGEFTNNSSIPVMYYLFVEIKATGTNGLEAGDLTLDGKNVPALAKDVGQKYLVAQEQLAAGIEPSVKNFTIKATGTFEEGETFSVTIMSEAYQVDAPISIPAVLVDDGTNLVANTTVIDPETKNEVPVIVTVPKNVTDAASVSVAYKSETGEESSKKIILDLGMTNTAGGSITNFEGEKVTVKLTAPYPVGSVVYNGDGAQPTDFECVLNENGTYNVQFSTTHFSEFVLDGAAAKIGSGVGEKYYGTLADAINDAASGATITVLKDHTTDGVSVNKSIIVDFDGCVVTSTGGAGSTGTKTQAFQLLKGNDVKFMNGTIVAASTSTVVCMIIQNYCNLTLDNMVLDGKDLSEGNDHATGEPASYYTLSNNCGTILLKDSTIIAHKDTEGRQGFAFDVYCFGGYTAPIVTVQNCNIIGSVQVDDGRESPSDTPTLIMDDVSAKSIIENDGTIDAGAKIGDIYYCTFEVAVKNVKNGDTIVLIKDSAGSGIKVESNKNFTVDFNKHKYTLSENAVGSTGTETNGFQLLKSSTITFKNGTIDVYEKNKTSAKFMIMIQNYSNLTLENMELDGTNLYGAACAYSPVYVLSNNNGTINISGSTSITAASGDFAFDVCGYSSYTDGPTVTVKTTGTITGNVECYDNGNTSRDPKPHLIWTAGNLDGKIIISGAFQKDWIKLPEGSNISIQ